MYWGQQSIVHSHMHLGRSCRCERRLVGCCAGLPRCVARAGTRTPASCVARKRSGTRPPSRPCRLTAVLKGAPARPLQALLPDVAELVIWPGVDGAKSGIVVTELSLIARTRARKMVELRGLEPLASCMPCASDRSIPVRHGRTGSRPPASTHSGTVRHGLRQTEHGGSPSWLPALVPVPTLCRSGHEAGKRPGGAAPLRLQCLLVQQAVQPRR